VQIPAASTLAPLLVLERTTG